jgi:hypothetical protein
VQVVWWRLDGIEKKRLHRIALDLKGRTVFAAVPRVSFAGDPDHRTHRYG